jgi:hypothetical protein
MPDRIPPPEGTEGTQSHYGTMGRTPHRSSGAEGGSRDKKLVDQTNHAAARTPWLRRLQCRLFAINFYF